MSSYYLVCLYLYQTYAHHKNFSFHFAGLLENQLHCFAVQPQVSDLFLNNTGGQLLQAQVPDAKTTWKSKILDYQHKQTNSFNHFLETARQHDPHLHRVLSSHPMLLISQPPSPKKRGSSSSSSSKKSSSKKSSDTDAAQDAQGASGAPQYPAGPLSMVVAQAVAEGSSPTILLALAVVLSTLSARRSSIATSDATATVEEAAAAAAAVVDIDSLPVGNLLAVLCCGVKGSGPLHSLLLTSPVATETAALARDDDDLFGELVLFSGWLNCRSCNRFSTCCCYFLSGCF